MISPIELIAFDYFEYAQNDAYNLPIIYVFAIIFGFIKKWIFAFKEEHIF